MTTPGTVHLVGAGPGHPGLITVWGLNALRSADVVACDRLIPPELLAETRKGAEVVYVGKIPDEQTVSQDEINALIVERARAGNKVVRLKGGDPYVFGRGYEEMCACREAGIPCTVIPGVSSALAAPAAAGIPITDRNHVRSFAVMTGRSSSRTTAPPLDYAALARIDAVVVLMGREALPEVVSSLKAAGRSGTTPVACVEWATTPRQRTIVGTLDTIVAQAEREQLNPPMVTVIGKVARLAEQKTRTVDPLYNKRIVITRPRSRAHSLSRMLSAAGAVPIACPALRIIPVQDNARLDDALGNLSDYDWVLFTSAHAVQACWRRFEVLHQDARCLSGCKVAAVGPVTAAALQRRGIRADLVPAVHTGEALAKALMDQKKGASVRILCPRSDLAPPQMPETLRQSGAIVDDVVVYRTTTVKPPESTLGLMAKGFDAVLFFSPSAVRAFRALNLPLGQATVACLGPSTAAAARQAGFDSAVVAREHTAAGMAAALREHFFKECPSNGT